MNCEPRGNPLPFETRRRTSAGNLAETLEETRMKREGELHNDAGFLWETSRKPA